MKKIMRFILVFSIIFSFCACSHKNVESTKVQERYSANFIDLFDTVTSVLAYADSKEEFDEISKFIEAELYKYHKYYDIYNNYEDITNLKTINDNAGKEKVKVDKEIIDLLLFAKDLYVKTDGKVNIAFGSVLEIWHDKREEAGIGELSALPSLDELKKANEHTDINKLIIDKENSTVFLSDADMRLDVGSIAKGYATELVAKSLEKKGYRHILLSVGGNVRAIGTKFDADNKEVLWSVGIQNPDLNSENKNVAVLKLSDKSLVTSGSYERYFEYEGKIYHHIINPDTLFPENEFLSISIVTNNSGYADALSTAVFNMTLDEGKKFIESLKDTEAMWILKDKSFVYSSGFEAMKK